MNSTCPLCGNGSSTEIFRALNQPAMLNRLLPTRDEAVLTRAVNLHFRCCNDVENCGFVWNAAFDAESVKYAPGYVNDQSQSPAFRAHLDNVRLRVASIIKSTQGDVLEIGCGQGDFLRELCALTDRSGIGFDPACVAPLSKEFPHPFSRDSSVPHRQQQAKRSSEVSVRVHRSVFDEYAFRHFNGPPSVVICRHVLEHLPNPLLVLKRAAEVLHRDGALYVEVPCIEWIIDNGAFFDLFNEHCSLFSTRSLERVLIEADFTAIRIDRVFGGQYLAAVARIDKRSDVHAPQTSPATLDPGAAGQLLVESKNKFKEGFANAIDTHPRLVWGAGAKGVSLVNHLGFDFRSIPALIDIHPLKRGRYVPITGQEVVSPTDIARFVQNEAPLILVMNPNYADEVRRTLSDLGIETHVHVLNGRPRVALYR